MLRRTLTAILLAVLAACGGRPPEVELVIPVNALCSTCDDYVRCDGGSPNAAVYDPTLNLYQLRPKGTLAQIATIWDFLIQIIRPKTGDKRPMTVYAQRPAMTAAFDRTVSPDQEARIDLVRHRIDVPGGWIDQTNGEWHAEDGSLRGLCRVLTRDEGRQVVALFAQSTAATPGS